MSIQPWESIFIQLKAEALSLGSSQIFEAP